MSERTESLLDEVVRLMVIWLREGAESQTQTIETLTGAGFSAARIAELLGTSAATVRVTQARAKKKGKKGGGT